MRSLFRGKRGGLLVFVLIAAVMTGGLAWATAAALRVEEEHVLARAEADRFEKFRLALWRLDGHVFPLLAKEASRPYNHYDALYTPPVALMKKGATWTYCKVYQPSPLINEELPSWVLLHFQTTQDKQWGSPQVLQTQDEQWLNTSNLMACANDMTENRTRLLAVLRAHLDPQTLISLVGQQELQNTLSLGNYLGEENRIEPSGQNLDQKEKESNLNAQPLGQQGGRANPQYNFSKGGKVDQDAQLRAGQKAQIDNQSKQSYQQAVPMPEQPRSERVQVRVGAITPLWLPLAENKDILVLARLVQVGEKTFCQGLIVDWPQLEKVLLERVQDLFPEARLLPVKDSLPLHPEQMMTALPLELDPGMPLGAGPAGWTPLRVGLALAWCAALIALLTVALGGWSLIDLSERRIRFVSAVTHELRTPLTTLRLYLDMLTSGMVREEQQRSEYLHTLHSEAERLHRLIGNVLDFSRLENQRTRAEKTKVAATDLVDQLRTTWSDRCRDAEKELVVENTLPAEMLLVTDPALVQQIIGNLIDNACKYSRHAEDPHIWVRAFSSPPGADTVTFEVEDCGPGIPSRERHAIFRPFCRGQGVDPTAGGVGLGLALAQRWARLLGGQLTLGACQAKHGACFRLELPA
jgi:signal transduction histidine kinase